MKNKRPASMLISAILASVMFIIIANSFMNLWGNSFTTLTAAKTATEAQNLSDIVSEKLKLEGVDAEEVTTKTPLSDITGNDDDDDWLYTYEIGNEFEDDDGNIFKVAEVKIYKDGEDNPRYSTEIPLSSSGSNVGEFGSNEYGYYWRFPNGNIFQWGYHNNGNYITFPIAFENKCVNVELTPTQTAWPGDERHPFIKEITNTQVRYEDRGVDQHYGLNPVYWSAFGY